MVINIPTATMLIDCPDQEGLVHHISSFIFQHHGNIVSIDQYVDSAKNWFYIRVKWSLEKFTIAPDAIADTFQTQLADKYKIKFQLFFSQNKPKVCIFVSKQAHCLYDLLSKIYTQDLSVDIACIISNHEDLASIANNFNINFHYIPITADSKLEQEAKTQTLLQRYSVDFIILARYMQVLSESFVGNYKNKIINIHHSFLPAFAGAKPYHAAFEKGVKIIGATAHYVTGALDEGPIIEQDVMRVEQGDTVLDLIRKGQDMEKAVLSRAVYLHLNHRTLVRNNKTIVFKE